MRIPKAIRDTITMDSGDGDVYGWGMSHWFDMAYLLYARDEDIPASWQFSPGACQTASSIGAALLESPIGADLLDMYDRGEITAGDVRLTGDILGRYLHHLKFHEVDY